MFCTNETKEDKEQEEWIKQIESKLMIFSVFNN